MLCGGRRHRRCRTAALTRMMMKAVVGTALRQEFLMGASLNHLAVIYE